MIKVNGEQTAWREGLTVQDILDDKNFTFRMISVWIDGVSVPSRELYPTTPVPDGSEVEVIHMISGG